VQAGVLPAALRNALRAGEPVLAEDTKVVCNVQGLCMVDLTVKVRGLQDGPVSCLHVQSCDQVKLDQGTQHMTSHLYKESHRWRIVAHAMPISMNNMSSRAEAPHAKIILKNQESTALLPTLNA
jgi:hypothetical protein